MGQIPAGLAAYNAQHGKGGSPSPTQSSGQPTLAQAFAVIEAHCDTPQAHAALKTLRSALEGKQAKVAPNNRNTPGGRQSGAANSPGNAFNKAGMAGMHP